MRPGVIGLWATTLALAAGALAQAAEDPIQSAFVVLADDGAPVARVVTTAPACPTIRLDGRRVPMSVRAAPATLPLRPTRSTPQESKPSAYPVLVCEAALPATARRARVGGHPLPLPVIEPQRIVVIGDTGCRIKSADHAAQACNDIHQYPFARIAASAAAWKPDLVVHVGDYLYREKSLPGRPVGVRGQRLGLWLGRLEGGLLRARRAPAGRRPLGRRARQPRKLQPRRPGLVAAAGAARPEARPGLHRSGA